MTKLELFKFDSCPFCIRVMDKIEMLKLKVEYRDIMNNRENLERLVKDTNRRSVPCLYIDNMPMFESSDIIQWLEDQKDQLEKV